MRGAVVWQAGTTEKNQAALYAVRFAKEPITKQEE